MPLILPENSAFETDPPDCAYHIENGVPVFEPTFNQFKDFAKFIKNIHRFGMETGIVKVIPPKQWIDSLPQLDQHIHKIKIKNPIIQNISGRGGLFRIQNIEKQKTYDISQWRALCDDREHQPPVGRKSQARDKRGFKEKKARGGNVQHGTGNVQSRGGNEHLRSGNEHRTGNEPRTNHWQTNALNSSFDYRFDDSEFTPERCHELEKSYWKSLTYNQPMYGADMPGSLFDDSVKTWNVPKLDNLLNQLNIRIPGVNTAYLYCGMWKSTFAWHLEDMDLFSINYIHFGAPKQWYSISQKDHIRFYQAMRDMWPEEYSTCKEFLRHKTFHASPYLLESMGIKVNKVIHRQHEFMLTFPYGYHSGFNLGYNVAESVNFADESWIPFGKKSKKCMCIDDAVGIDVFQLERHLKGEYSDDETNGITSLPTPPSEHSMGIKRYKKRKLENKTKETKIDDKGSICGLCRQICDLPLEKMVLDGKETMVHSFCLQYEPSRRNIKQEEQKDIRCYSCTKRGGIFLECSMPSCRRSYHPTCSIEAGMLAVPAGEDGRYEFFCRFHRPKRCLNEISEKNGLTKRWASSYLPGDIVQCQLEKSDIFGGIVQENNLEEEMMILKSLKGDELIEIDWKWVKNPGNEHLKAIMFDGQISTNMTVNATKYGRGLIIKGEKVVLSPIKDDRLHVTIDRGEGDEELSWINETLTSLTTINMEEMRDTRVYYYYLNDRSSDTVDNYCKI